MPRIQPGPRKALRQGANDSASCTWEARLRLWIAVDGRSALGPGKVRLLEAIAATKSLSEAAKQLRMSYRLAWKHLRVLEDRTGIAVVEPKRGGTGGGGTDLTPEGQALLEAYANCRRDVNECTRSACERYFARWASGRSGGTRPEPDRGGANASSGKD